ncbi:unnamed protein product [Rotaria socialis]|uniref:Uncharacterized protein n=1 Tax=Rotaria socialis TaxID=392032 RepID=A0A817UZ32_9BILA|nr:unnamed protein product [Rotaria socialis]
MTVESQRDIQDQPYVNNDDDRDIAICQRRPLNEYQQVHNRNAVCARFKISESHWNEFFYIRLRRTLTQMICDVHRKTEWILNDRNSLNNDHNSLTVLYSTNRYVHSRRYFEWFTS